jgi:uncharacterized protein (TIGR00288 family)
VAEGERSLAIFIDFENLALGFQGRRERFDIIRVLERLVEKGKIVAKKAYADWNRFAGFTAGLHEAAIELIEIPRRAQSGKNSADIRLCVDAMDLAYSKEHINTFVVLSGDSDFSPLVSKLKELGKHVIGLGMQESTSELLRDNCDEFIYYEDLGHSATLATAIDSHLPETKRKAFALLLESLLALRRENKESLWSSMVKDTMKRKKPSFNETYHGYRTFSELLEDAQKEGLLELETDKRSRTYVVTRFGSEMHHDKPTTPGLPDARPGPQIAIPASRSGPSIAVPASRPMTPIPIPSGPGAMPGNDPMTPGKRKSRRRRRRGGGGVINGINGPGASTGFAAGVPLSESRPDTESASGTPGPEAVEPPAPSESLPPPEPESAPESRGRKTAETSPQVVETGEAAPAPAPKTRTRTSRSRQGTTTRSRKSTSAGESPKKASAESAATRAASEESEKE